MDIVLNNLNYEVFDDRADYRFGYKLKAGDIVRFGRVRFIVRRVSREPGVD